MLTLAKNISFIIISDIGCPTVGKEEIGSGAVLLGAVSRCYSVVVLFGSSERIQTSSEASALLSFAVTLSVVRGVHRSLCWLRQCDGLVNGL